MYAEEIRAFFVAIDAIVVLCWRGFRRALNLSPLMPRDASRTSDCCGFCSLACIFSTQNFSFLINKKTLRFLVSCDRGSGRRSKT